jgi:hypothetical protein
MVAKLRKTFEIAKRFIKKLRVKDKRQQGQQKKTSATSKGNFGKQSKPKSTMIFFWKG